MAKVFLLLCSITTMNVCMRGASALRLVQVSGGRGSTTRLRRAGGEHARAQQAAGGLGARYTWRTMSTSALAGEAEGGGGTAAVAGSGGRSSAAVQQAAGEQTNSDSRKGGGKKGKQKLDLQPPKGTRDFYPEDMRLRNWLFGHWKAVAQLYGFEEYDAPVLESEELYTRKSGEEVTQQLYNFKDKGDRPVSLRPEMTPSLARMVLAKKKGLTLPVKWFSIPQCWRYERMTRGRRREHFQWNMDIWGLGGVEAEAELLGAMVTFFERVGLTSADVGIKVNSRGVLVGILTSLGVPEDKHAATCVLVDKLEKVPLEALSQDMEALGLENTTVEKLLDTLKLRDLAAVEELLGSESKVLLDLKKLFSLAETYGYADWLVFDSSVVRGLAYYTGLVFEAFDRQGVLRAVCGGGRYDKLLESFGGEALPACGFGFGDAVIVELLKEKDLLPARLGEPVTTIVYAYSAELQADATAVAARLRRAGVTVDMVLESKKPKWVFKHADRLGAKYVVLVAPSEWKEGQVSVKELATGEQTAVPLDDVVSYMTKGGEGSDDAPRRE